jgi:hypothetical protein
MLTKQKIGNTNLNNVPSVRGTTLPISLLKLQRQWRQSSLKWLMHVDEMY